MWVYAGRPIRALDRCALTHKYSIIKKLPETPTCSSFLLHRVPDIKGYASKIKPRKVIWKTPSLTQPDPDNAEMVLKNALSLWGLNMPNVVKVHNAGMAPMSFIDKALYAGDDAVDLNYMIDELLDLSYFDDPASEKKASEDSHFPYVETEWLDGGDLDNFISNHRDMGLAVPASVVLYIMRSMASGCFQASIDRKLVHNSLCPVNVALSLSGSVKLAEYGFSTHHDSLDSNLRRKHTGYMEYMSPELIEFNEGGSRGVKVMSDIYSIGAICYELATLCAPVPFARELSDYPIRAKGLKTGREAFSAADECLDELVNISTRLFRFETPWDMLTHIDECTNPFYSSRKGDSLVCTREEFSYYLCSLRMLYRESHKMSHSSDDDMASCARYLLTEKKIFKSGGSKGDEHPFQFMSDCFPEQTYTTAPEQGDAEESQITDRGGRSGSMLPDEDTFFWGDYWENHGDIMDY